MPAEIKKIEIYLWSFIRLLVFNYTNISALLFPSDAIKGRGIDYLSQRLPIIIVMLWSNFP